ncbi:TPA: hypothetical protein L5P37_002298 [Pseudomonas aeruginosa]|nr:hypothetical protein [Pseudomonas aeruginosa]
MSEEIRMSRDALITPEGILRPQIQQTFDLADLSWVDEERRPGLRNIVRELLEAQPKRYQFTPDGYHQLMADAKTIWHAGSLGPGSD